MIDAIDRGDAGGLRDELGDFLLEAVFLAQISHERGDFHIGDALRAICDKLVRRHPHVFGDEAGAESMTAADVKRQWEAIKADEQQAAGREPSLLGAIPESLPALLRAYRLGRRAATVGFDWPDPGGVEAKVVEELAEVAAARAGASAAALEEEIGDLLFSVANLARHLDVDPVGAAGGQPEVHRALRGARVAPAGPRGGVARRVARRDGGGMAADQNGRLTAASGRTACTPFE